MKVLVIDDFLKDPSAERRRALKARYSNVEHNGISYRGIAKTVDLENQKRIDGLIGFGDSKDVTCFYRRYLESEESETYIHSDVQIGHFTAILYLSDPKDCRGGIAFWRHRKYGWELQPTVQELARHQLKDTPELWAQVYEEGFDESKWEMFDYVPIEFNRLVVFYSPRFHSRYPKKSFGTELKDSRLIKTWFLKYDRVGT